MPVWPPGPGVLVLPSGRAVRGRSLRSGADEPPADFELCLLARRPADPAPDRRWVRWPDFRVPADPDDARAALAEAWRRSGTERVGVACAGGRGRTGTALACLAVLDGVAADRAVAYVRERYDPRAVETPGQRRWVPRFAAAGPPG